MAATFDEYLQKLYNARSMAQQPQQQAQAGSQGTAGDIDLSKASPAGNAAAGAFNIAGTSQATQAGLSQYGQRYQMSDAVSQAKDYLEGVMSSKPGEYSSNYAGQIQSLYNQIMNRPEFKYDVNKDPLFQSYKNNYMQTGQRAMQDAVGTAAGLTGGYGNSWGATAGYQAYQWYLQQLNNAIPDLEQRAFDKYRYYGDEMRNNMEMNMALDQMEYGRYRDTVQDWMADRAFANTLYGQERNWDMADWQGLQDYYQNLAAMETSSYRADRAEDLDWARLAEQQRQYDTDEAYRRDVFSEDTRRYDQDFGEKQRQFNENLDFQKYAQALDEAYRRDTLAENIRQYNQDFGENQRQYNENMDFKRYEQALDEAYRRDTMAENIRQYNQNFAEDQRQYNQNFAENVRQADLDEAYRQATLAEQQRQYNQNFGETVRQNDLDEAYRQATLAEQQRQYNQNFAEDQRQFNENKDFQKYVQALDEAYRRDTLAENIRQYEQNFGEDVRQYDANLAEKQREFDIAQALDQAQFDFQVRKYEEALAAAGLTGGSGGGNGGSNTQTAPESVPQNAGQTKPLNAVYMPELVDIARINAANNPALSNLASPEGKSLLTEALEKDLKSQKGDMVTLPITPVAADGTVNQGPLAKRTQPMPREQAEELISAMEDLNKQLGKQTSTTKKKTGTQNSTSTSAKSGTSTLDQLLYGTRKQK